MKYILLFIFYTWFSNSVKGQVGTVPINSPTGGFRIDGYLQRQGVAGDWLPGTGSGGSVLGSYVIDNSGLPVIPVNLYELHDLWNDQFDDVFSSGRFNDDPNTMRWMSKKSHPKNDINNCTFFIRKDAQHHIWLVFSADRQKSGGDSYIDFEFFQNTITQTGGPIPGGTGGFYSSGPHGGRTIGDITLSVNFEKTSNSTSALIYQWQPTNNDGTQFGYVPIPLPNGKFFAASNTTSINIPSGAFGSNSYLPHTFVEMAIDVTQAIGGSGLGDECGKSSLPFKTIWIKSRSSASLTANLVDFIRPIQVSLEAVYSAANVFTNINYIDLQSGQFNATVTPGTNDDYNFNWSALGIIIDDLLDGTIKGTLNDDHISNPIFTNNPGYICYRYVWGLTITRKSDNCLIASTRIVLPSPCDRIGKPINPDQMQQGEVLLEENISTEQEVRIFPNPAKGSSTVTLTGENSVKDITLIDMKGAILRRWAGIPTNTLQLKDLPSGLYLLKIFSKATGKTVTKKIIVDE